MRGTEIRKDTIPGEKDSEGRDWRCQATSHSAGSFAKSGHIYFQPNTGKQRLPPEVPRVPLDPGTTDSGIGPC